MRIENERQLAVAAFALAAVIIIVASRWGGSSSGGAPTNSLGADGRALGGPPNPVQAFFDPRFGARNFAEFIEALNEDERQCVKQALGEEYAPLLASAKGFFDNTYYIKNESRVIEMNKCFR